MNWIRYWARYVCNEEVKGGGIQELLGKEMCSFWWRNFVFSCSLLCQCNWLHSVPVETARISRTELQIGIETPSVPPRMKFWPIPIYFGHSCLFWVILTEIQISIGINFGFLFPYWTYLFCLLARSKLKATLFLLQLGLNSKLKATISPLALSLSLKVSRKEISSSIFWRELCTSRGTLWS